LRTVQRATVAADQTRARYSATARRTATVADYAARRGRRYLT